MATHLNVKSVRKKLDIPGIGGGENIVLLTVENGNGRIKNVVVF
jgi:hypothetical protein